jgi:hypothetical protein
MAVLISIGLRALKNAFSLRSFLISFTIKLSITRLIPKEFAKLTVVTVLFAIRKGAILSISAIMRGES